ncbi:glycosyltransferase family 4 protein [Cellulomonas xylanilytica]|uniref:Uncharacterized protein n=1 Tax=Cellulomonas xylanilytica TaxID=233583 RepID=A0A510V3M7_9CELL|nr:glycosyltransferase family 1 protein [Cellulomonas xylanilytica]GEK21487.1 hypothetical protein CXY01_20070 [Cellulomonas xylanilytica]
MPGRILDRHVGGNTTYARAVRAGLVERGIEVSTMRYSSRAAITAAWETVEGLRNRPESTVVHYVADTGPLLGTRAPSVVTVHGVASRWISSARNARQESVWRRRVARAIAGTDHVITVSESSADDVAAIFGIARDSLTVIPHGVDTASLRTPVGLPAHLATTLPEEFLLYVGNIEPRKNLVELVRAHAADPSLPPLVVAGRPAWNSEDAMRAIADAPRVTYLGFVAESEKVALIQACTAFVFPSLYEGFGLPVLEALAAGAPVITSDRGSLPEVAGPSRMLTSLDADGIAAGITDALGDEAWLAACRQEGPIWSDSFSWARSTDRHIEVYERVLTS